MSDDRPEIAKELVGYLASELEAANSWTDENFEPSCEAAHRILQALSEDFGVSLPRSIPRKMLRVIRAKHSDAGLLQLCPARSSRE